jgi:hypothetical protein
MIALGAIILFMGACSQGSSNDATTATTDTAKPDSTGVKTLSEGTFAEATSASVTGTWVETVSNDAGTITSITTWIFDASGNFTHVIDLTTNFTGTAKHSWEGETGKAAFAENVVTLTISKMGKSGTAAFDAATAVWTSPGFTKIEKKNAVIIDQRLCIEAIKRVGTGRGIEGNWEEISSIEYPGMPTINTYEKSVYVFTASGYTEKQVSSSSPTFDTIDVTTDSAYTFTIQDGYTLKCTDSGETVTQTVHLSGNWLYLGTGGNKTS